MEILAEQVLHALYELLRGFEAADERAQGKLLRELAARNPADIYGGLVTVLLRLVFTLFAEDRGLLPGSGLYVRHYAVRGLFERLRADAERYPDTMDHRFGAWAQLLALFRVIHGGCKHPDLAMPARAGHLFDPDRYPFLEGRASRSEPIGALPLVSDGTLHRILEKLCILEGERVSYRTLDVEEIGSVYQTIMGFGVETAAGTAIALKGKRKNGGVPASPVISLEQLLAIPAKDRAKWLKENADTDLTGEADKRLKTAATVDDLLVALEKRIDRHATPAPVAQGGLVLQPTDERRRSGSHYTPRSFTEPIVRKTLEPILKRLAEQAPGARVSRPAAAPIATDALKSSPASSASHVAAAQESRAPITPTPDQILSLKICDIAVGSAAFLVETCRQLADVLVRAWRVHGGRPALPPDETEELLAMRTIAQRCLYGVDRNPMAVDLAKLSLWLATLAKDHPFTFLDHAIRCGDSLVGLTRRQIETFTWKTESKQGQLWEAEVRKRTAAALRERQNLLGLGDDYGTPQLKREKLEKADELLDLVRFIGDAAVAAFFAADKDKAREAKRAELAERIADYLGKGDLKQRPTDEVKALRSGQFPVTPFHWEIEYPEVFDRENPGFDGIVGNPPFLGGKRVSTVNGDSYLAWLLVLHEEASGNSDLVAHFFRRAFSLLSTGGAFGLISTNTISQGDTRATGLRWICTNRGTIYAAQKRFKWPGQAAVVVSVVWVGQSAFGLREAGVPLAASCFLDEQSRMPETICAVVSRAFYDGKLTVAQDCLNDLDWKSKRNVGVSESERIQLVGISAAGQWSAQSGGPVRKESADHIVQLVKHHLQTVDRTDIVVLTPFRSQRSVIRAALRRAEIEGVSVSTVHRAQGSERLIVFFDPVAGDNKFLNGAEGRRLINVAMSRTQALLYIFASAADLRNPTLAAVAHCMGRTDLQRTPLFCELVNHPDFPRIMHGQIFGYLGMKLSFREMIHGGASLVARNVVSQQRCQISMDGARTICGDPNKCPKGHKPNGTPRTQCVD